MFYTSPIASRFQGIGIAVILLMSTVFLPHLVRPAEQDQIRWDNKYATEKYLFGREAIPFLQDHVDLLPKGPVLDLAMGEGRNGVFLAAKGYQVTGIDISEEGLKKAQALAAEYGVTLKTVVADLDTYEIPPNTFDVIICTYYLQRDLFPKIAAALKPGGMALIETYALDHLQYQPRFNKAYLLLPNELLTMLPGLRVIHYQEVDTGQAAFASILAQKPQ
ncbi:MAG: class I SAM-dependent methyltransferase [Nitrospirales bacterium]|nr:MAG: class I SAM-dependent methyltransferase [Nitrospirales bacterium]